MQPAHPMHPARAGFSPKAPAQVVQAALVAQNLTTGYDGAKIIEGLDIAVPQGKVSVIIGGNGCGKSTLLKTLARLIKLQGGAVLLDGRDIYRLPTKKLAQQLGLLPQTSVALEGIRVCDLVARGRYPYQTLFSGMGRADYEAVCEALDLMGIAELAERTVDELSGGQRQRVWIAMALAQQTDVLLLDEPTTYLDVAYQIEDPRPHARPQPPPRHHGGHGAARHQPARRATPTTCSRWPKASS